MTFICARAADDPAMTMVMESRNIDVEGTVGRSRRWINKPLGVLLQDPGGVAAIGHAQGDVHSAPKPFRTPSRRRSRIIRRKLDEGARPLSFHGIAFALEARAERFVELVLCVRRGLLRLLLLLLRRRLSRIPGNRTDRRSHHRALCRSPDRSTPLLRSLLLLRRLRGFQRINPGILLRPLVAVVLVLALNFLGLLLGGEGVYSQTLRERFLRRRGCRR